MERRPCVRPFACRAPEEGFGDGRNGHSLHVCAPAQHCLRAAPNVKPHGDGAFPAQSLDEQTITEVLDHLQIATHAAPQWAKAWHQVRSAGSCRPALACAQTFTSSFARARGRAVGHILRLHVAASRAASRGYAAVGRTAWRLRWEGCNAHKYKLKPLVCLHVTAVGLL